MSNEIVSYEPATGEELWRGKRSDVDDVVARARRAWPAWAAQPLATRMELVRRFANEVRKESDKFAELIARETGKPMWEARSEVETVVAKVEISIRAYAERTSQRKLDNAMQGTMAVRHKPHGVMAVLGPFNFPAHLPNGHIVPALIAGNVIVFKASEKTPAVGEFLCQCFNRLGCKFGIKRRDLFAQGSDILAVLTVSGPADHAFIASQAWENRKVNQRKNHGDDKKPHPPARQWVVQFTQIFVPYMARGVVIDLPRRGVDGDPARQPQKDSTGQNGYHADGGHIPGPETVCKVTHVGNPYSDRKGSCAASSNCSFLEGR